MVGSRDPSPPGNVRAGQGRRHSRGVRLAGRPDAAFGGEVYHVDEASIQAAIERYLRMERLLADFDKAVAKVQVTVRSPDGLVEVVVAADGTIRDVVISDEAAALPPRELAASVQDALAAAGDGARWAKRKLHTEMFGEFPALGSR
jgi:DNA-binding protein YbaB